MTHWTRLCFKDIDTTDYVIWHIVSAEADGENEWAWTNIHTKHNSQFRFIWQLTMNCWCLYQLCSSAILLRIVLSFLQLKKKQQHIDSLTCKSGARKIISCSREIHNGKWFYSKWINAFAFNANKLRTEIDFFFFQKLQFVRNFLWWR